MAKKRQELGDDLAPDPIKLKKKTLPVDSEKAEKVIKKVHKEKKVINEESEKMKHLNISFPMSIYKELKNKAVDEDTTFKQLVLEYVSDGLGKKRPQRRDRRGNLK